MKYRFTKSGIKTKSNAMRSFDWHPAGIATTIKIPKYSVNGFDPTVVCLMDTTVVWIPGDDFETPCATESFGDLRRVSFPCVVLTKKGQGWQGWDHKYIHKIRTISNTKSMIKYRSTSVKHSYACFQATGIGVCLVLL